MDRLLWADRSRQAGTSADVVAAVDGAQLLLDRFEAWPTFEDFEVISLQFARGNVMKIFKTEVWPDLIEPSLVVTFYGFDIRYSSADAKRKPTLITLRFHGPFERFALDGFNHQNPICGLEITFEYSDNLKRKLFSVDWGGAGVHHDVCFTCARVEVVATEAWVEGP